VSLRARLRTIEDDLRPLNFDLVTARRRALDGVNSWRRPRLRAMLRRQRDRA